jgi:hypothetical protein
MYLRFYVLFSPVISLIFTISTTRKLSSVLTLLYCEAFSCLRTACELYALVNGWEGKRSFTFNYLLCCLGTLFIATIRCDGFQLSILLLWRETRIYYCLNSNKYCLKVSIWSLYWTVLQKQFESTIFSFS